MSDKSFIEWTDATWNPITGCSKVSQGCKNCYAKHQAWPRLAAAPNTVYSGRAFEDVRVHHERLDQPLRWTKPRRIFVNSMSDLFHEAVPFTFKDQPFGFVDKVFAAMALAPQHQFQVLTKRPERMREYLTTPKRSVAIWLAARSLLAGGPRDVYKLLPVPRPGTGLDGVDLPVWPLPNVWLGVSVEDQDTAADRIPHLLETPAAVRWISAEPLLGHIHLGYLNWPSEPIGRARDGYNALLGFDHTKQVNCPRLDWVVVGGESGPDARPMHPEWARSLRNQCVAADVRFLFKQWGEHVECDLGNCDTKDHRFVEIGGADSTDWTIDRHSPQSAHMVRIGKRRAGRELDGRTWDEYPQ